LNKVTLDGDFASIISIVDSSSLLLKRDSFSHPSGSSTIRRKVG